MKLFHLVSLLFLFFSPQLRATTLGPPKLLSQSAEEVWYKLDISSNPLSKPTLKCQASDNAESYKWYKNGELLEIGGDLEWILPGQSGTIVINTPKREHQGYYQCFVSNIFGTAVSNKIFLRLGVLEHFAARPMRTVEAVEGDAVTLACSGPRGNPEPTIFWLYRDTEQESVIETIRKRHITADDQGQLHFSSVEPSDGRSTLIYECAATSPVLHGEYRSGDQIQLHVLPRTSKQPILISALYLSPPEVTVKAGGRLKIQCIFGGRPVPTVNWIRMDGDLPKFRMKSINSAESDYGKSLIIENVHPGDAGRYQCSAAHLTHTINVRVLAAPYWDLEPPQDVTQSEESTTELECLASGHPEPIIRWSMNGIPLHELKEDSRRLILDNGRILRLKELNHDVDTGVYQCNASNPLGYIYANAYVHVRAHAPRFLMPTQRVWKVVIHSTVSLNCDVDAAPEAIVRWVDTDDKPLLIRDAKTQVRFEIFILTFL
ncbi:unnamed protein product [Auanema sp. JU1783]|nr:unnamed protein product [Auanema sp. JU1783]